MKAIYWGLMVRCDEKLLDWIPALQGLITCIIEGSKTYPESRKVYTDLEPVEDYSVVIENSYPILEDESEEKSTDMAEVQTQVMSRKAYMKKWRGLSDEDVEDELNQIALEQDRLREDNYMMPTEIKESVEAEGPIEEE